MNVLIVDDELLAREGLYSLISRFLPASTITAVATLEEAVARVSKRDVDLVFLDLNLGGPEASGLQLLRKLKDDLEARCPVIVVSALEDQLVVQEVFRLGASGFVEKRVADYAAFRDAIQKAARDGVHVPAKTMDRLRQAFASRCIDGANLAATFRELSNRQRQIASLISTGSSNKMIARHLGIAETSVKTHVTALFRRFRVANRMEFLALLVDHKIDLGPSFLAAPGS